ncbi:PepSY domain-containing protein [Belnapia rosea]|uniref:Peptidase propeptide and YPEB domain-containing protein n=1 Tax=Belnapia rosea TaxID=938405 RepID=A0A1G6YX23_9PROT|nr:PepSY domain-containing protein [Belnapia rosea]SDD95054.1 Peptidase propeptide and YPEB domain-containing protein [Belnapia rosea]
MPARLRRAPLLHSWILAAALAVLPTAAPRADDDRPSPEERVRIEAALRGLGFVRWGEIERENDGRAWEIDDARNAEGRQYDLKLAADDLRELWRREDN